jgi:hypothetical protein
MSVKYLIQFRRDTAANWTSVNPSLAVGEIGYETDTGKYKVGRVLVGITPATWTALPYSTLLPTGGTTGQVLAKSGTTDYATEWTTPSAPGLEFISSTTIGTAVPSVTISNIFNSTYDHYRIMINGSTISTNANLRLQLNNSTASYYGGGIQTLFSTGGVSSLWDNNVSRFNNIGYGSEMYVDVFNPFLARSTRVSSAFYTNVASGNYTGYILDSNSSTGFIISPAPSATLTGGTISVYGYRKV